jgi:hypothetical protein
MDYVAWLSIPLVIAAFVCIVSGLWFQRHRRCPTCEHWIKTMHPYCPHCGVYIGFQSSDPNLQVKRRTPVSRQYSDLRSDSSKSVTRTISIPSRIDPLDPPSSTRRLKRATHRLEDGFVVFPHIKQGRPTRETTLPEENLRRSRTIRHSPRVTIRSEDDVPTVSRTYRSLPLISKRLVCPSCQDTISSHDDFCGHCGSPLMII